MRRIRLFNTNFELITLLAIVAFGVLLRVEAHRHLINVSPDGVAFIEGAIRVLNGVGIFHRRGPLFQLLLMISFTIFGASFESSTLVPLFFGSIVPILLFFLGKHFFDAKTGLFAALLGALNPQLIDLSCWVLRETTSSALILLMIFAAHFSLRIRSKKRSLIASVLPGFLSGLLILTREEMIFVIPPAYIAYIFLCERKRLDFVMRTVVFSITTMLTITPWLLYSNTYFGDPFYSYTYYLSSYLPPQGDGSTPGAAPSTWSYTNLSGALSTIIFGLWKELTEFPANLSLLGLLFFPIGVVFAIKKQGTWMIYLTIVSDLLILSPEFFPLRHLGKPAATYYWNDVSRIIFSALMPANIIVAYGIRRFIPFLSNWKGAEVTSFNPSPSLVKGLTILCLIIFGAITYIPPYTLNLQYSHDAESALPFKESAEYLNSIGSTEGVFTMQPKLLARYYQGPIYQLPEKGGFEHILEEAKNKGVKYLIVESTCVNTGELIDLYYHAINPNWRTIPPQFVLMK
ncbi:MAG: ArnT family glycosyltransferase, partial [Candidatus Heimdallarchaeota archaeon]